MTVPYAVDPTIVSSDIVRPTTVSQPTLVSIGQGNLLVVASVIAPNTVVNSPLSAVRLYRSIGGSTPEQVDERQVDRNSTWLNLFDQTPEYGTLASYTATAVAQDGTESMASSAQLFTAVANPTPLETAGGISRGALGPYPLLGSDIFLHPVTGDAVVGPNGDMLTVNSLELLAQDLRIRILTLLGELPLHLDYGFFAGRTIGAGLSNPQAQAAILRTRIIDCISADPRVYSVDNVTVAFQNSDGWTISYAVYAIGVEDPLERNLVIPYATSF